MRVDLLYQAEVSGSNDDNNNNNNKVLIIIMSENHCKHSLESNAILYLPLHKGGKGLQQLEMLYKSTKIKTAHYVTTSNEPHVQLVATFQKYKETKSFRSMFQDAKMFADQLNLDVEYDITKKTTIASNKNKLKLQSVN